MKYIVIVILAAIVLGYFFQAPKLVDDSKKQTAKEPSILLTPNNSNSNTSTHDHVHDTDHNQSTQPSTAPTGATGNPHFDQLSPEMQQAVKDSLLLEGPMKTYTRPDGSVMLPADGRFTQMPVAVEMPDGSIEIREYSVVPKPRTPSEK
ncbi:MAG: hypothetical protein ACI8SR_001655 [Oceanicoccus sp.]|jgi:hypothetical protein